MTAQMTREPDSAAGANTVAFTLDGCQVLAGPDETIWEAARRSGVEIPHLCHAPEPGYRPDGNCRACMVEIEGERVLAASCIRRPAEDMVVSTESARASFSRRMVFELLVADQPPRERAHDAGSRFWDWADRIGVRDSRFAAREPIEPDLSHPAMAVNLDACINCTLCVRACREVQVNDVIGMARRGAEAQIVFDFDDPMAASSCVGCGECVQACPTGALLPAAVASTEGRVTADRSVESLCPYCGVGCQLTLHVKDDRLLFVDGRNGPSNRNRLCVKGRFGFDYIHHPDRLVTPLIRRTGVPKDLQLPVGPDKVSDVFREASWEEALDAAAAGLQKVIAERGGSALAGFGSAKGSNEEAYLFQKLVRTGFGTNNVDHCTRLCHASSVAALMETVNSGAVSVPFGECENAEVIIVIGANPAANHPVAATFFKNAVRKGSTLIVIDPQGQSLARHAAHVLAFKPGTDVALLNAMLHTVMDEDLVNREFVDRYTEGFAALETQVKAFPPEKIADLVGIDATEIRHVARLYATARSSIVFWGMGISQHVHGTDNARCLISLALLTGQIGRPGTGLHPLRGQNNVQGASDAGLIPMVYPDYQAVDDDATRAEFERLWRSELRPEPGLTVVEIMNAIRGGEIRAMYVMGENPAMSDPDLHHARAALASLEHLVVQDLFLTETAAYADVVLPASGFPEKDGSFTNTNRQVQIGRKALPLPGEARQDLWIIQELARRLGLDWTYGGPSDVFEEMRQCMPSIRGISWERLVREDSVTYPVEREDQPGQEIIFTDGFPTASGRGRFVPAELTQPDEIPDDDYPLILTTGRLLEHWHTGAMTRRSQVLDRIEPEATAALAPAELAEHGLQVGDPVCVETRRGAIELKVRADGNVPKGMVFIPFCYVEAAANLLTNPALDPVGKIPEFKYCAARLTAAGTGKVTARPC